MNSGRFNSAFFEFKHWMHDLIERIEFLWPRRDYNEKSDFPKIVYIGNFKKINENRGFSGHFDLDLDFSSMKFIKILESLQKYPKSAFLRLHCTRKCFAWSIFAGETASNSKIKNENLSKNLFRLLHFKSALKLKDSNYSNWKSSS